MVKHSCFLSRAMLEVLLDCDFDYWELNFIILEQCHIVVYLLSQLWDLHDLSSLHIDALNIAKIFLVRDTTSNNCFLKAYCKLKCQKLKHSIVEIHYNFKLEVLIRSLRVASLLHMRQMIEKKKTWLYKILKPTLYTMPTMLNMVALLDQTAVEFRRTIRRLSKLDNNIKRKEISL